MANVPNVPGVPPLSSYGANNITLLVEDAVSVVLGTLGAPQWGIYLNGVAVLSYDNQVSFSYKQDWKISTYPVEQGSFQSYDKVQLPFDVRVRLNCSGPVAQRQAFLSTLDAMSNTTQLFDVHTPERTYANCSVSHIGFDREATAGAAMIQADIWFQQIRLTQAATFQNPQNPADTGQINSGTVQTSTLPPIPGSVVSSSPFLQAP